MSLAVFIAPMRHHLISDGNSERSSADRRSDRDERAASSDRESDRSQSSCSERDHLKAASWWKFAGTLASMLSAVFGALFGPHVVITHRKYVTPRPVA